MDASLIVSKLETAFSTISKKDNIAIADIKIGVGIRPAGDGQNKLDIDLYSGETKIRTLDISTEIIGLKRTKEQLKSMNAMGRAMYDLHNATEKLESFLAVGIFNKCTMLNFDFTKSTFFVSKPAEKFVSKLVFGDKIKELTLEEIFSMEGMLG